MELLFRAKFFRDFRKIKNKEVLRITSDVFKRIERAKSIDSIGGLKKLREYAHYYRFKITVSQKADYRLVFSIRGNKVWAERITSAKKIFYKQ